MSQNDSKPSPSGNRRKPSVSTEALQGMCPQQRSRYLAYEEPAKEVKSYMSMSRQRLSAWQPAGAGGKRQTPVGRHHSCETDKEEKRKQEKRGQKEARHRLRKIRLQYQSMRNEEIKLMISGQSNALDAIRLERLLPSEESKTPTADCLSERERKRVEEILEDEDGLTLYRT
ncbi:hypothetical protein UPYG_G00001790 [Umbra pygmaea]|uniref:Uncharacterized protein n=1 Tax=Umbra pygmaea TaxID=75934 RepID=A0ABD0XJB3_UMBPY